MHSSEYGEKVREAIRKKGFTMQKAADKLGMSRRNLYYYLAQREPDDSFVHSVQSKLHIVVQMRNGETRISKVPIVFDSSEGGQPELFSLREKVSHLETLLKEKDRTIVSQDITIASQKEIIKLLSNERITKKNGM